MLVSAIEYYQELGLQPFILNHGGVGDMALIESIIGRLSNEVPVIVEPDALKVKALICGSVAVLSSRYHGCVSALSAGIPCIGTSWSHKYELLYEQYKVAELLIKSSYTIRDLKNLIDLALSKETGLNDHINAQAQRLKTESHAMWQHVGKIIDEYKNLETGSAG